MRLSTGSAVPARAPTHRHGLTRRQLLGSGVGAVGALAGAQLVYGAPAHASGPAGAPWPIPGGIQPFGPGTETYHVFLPGTGEPNTITDFNGFVGVGVIDGTVNGPASGLVFEVDNRFIAGEYVGLNGRHYNAAFGFL